MPAFKKPKLFQAPAAAAGAQQYSRQAAPQQPAPAASAADTAAGEAITFAVLYTKRAKFSKRNDRGFADGVMELQLADKAATLYDMEGKVITKGKLAKLPAELESGSILELGNFVAEYDKDISTEDYKRGTCFTDACKLAAQGPANPFSAAAMPAFKPTAGRKAGGLRPRSLQNKQQGPGGSSAAPAATALFDPAAPGAVVVNGQQWQEGKGKLSGGRPVVPVVIDPYVGRHLRLHQREGVTFLYECVMGLRSDQYSGCLLADEMGLGKTLQVIALLWTLLRQGPEGSPVARKAIVVAPATLVANWGKEVNKWLGSERLRFIQLPQGPEAAAKVQDFKLGNVWRLLIGSYETLRKHTEALAGVCDVLVCDEGHRLKATGGNKTIDALQQLGCKRRIVLTGTPLQNNLQELHALLSFAVGDVLGTASQFKRIYGDPITRSRDKDASSKERELGAARAEELQRQTATFILRRTQEVLSKHLPPLAVHTVFCQPSPLQVEVYRGLLRSKKMTSLLYGAGSGTGDSEGVLPAITLLRKLCNHPKLLLQDGAAQQQPLQHAVLQGNARLADVAAALLQEQLGVCRQPVEAVELSGKLQALAAVLDGAIHAEGSKVVVVSTSTSALDLIDNLLCGPRGWQSVRIDGGTSVDERQTIVDNFNCRGVGQVFLLSTRAGGAGLNLIGANHLVLYDSDWNPAMDKQAMARIWRDGQKRPCFVHRMLTTGTIEEKVYQRQIMKSDLASATMVSGSSAAGLSQNELKQLFSLELGTDSSCSGRHTRLKATRQVSEAATSKLLGGCGAMAPDV
ncbi:hypothetical protein OEZ86_006234 [Tetradesmus obliquus]|nr:hypothetical protein OEZ86_006234 [Tetradesmus obliquus]